MTTPNNHQAPVSGRESGLFDARPKTWGMAPELSLREILFDYYLRAFKAERATELANQYIAAVATPQAPVSGRESEEAALWCMHIAGLDDVHAAPDFWTALSWAAELNAALAAKAAAEAWAADDNYPLTQASAQRWPGTAESHAESLKRELAERAEHDARRAAALATAPQASAGREGEVTDTMLHAAMEAYQGKDWSRDLGSSAGGCLRDMRAAITAALALATPPAPASPLGTADPVRGVEEHDPARILDFKWLDPECISKGCQSLVWKGLYESAVKGRADFRDAYRAARTTQIATTTGAGCGERERKRPTACIGWPTIKRLAEEGAVSFSDMDLIAASDLFGLDIGVLVPRVLSIDAGKTSHHAHSMELAAKVLRKAAKPASAESCEKAAAYLRSFTTHPDTPAAAPTPTPETDAGGLG